MINRSLFLLFFSAVVSVLSPLSMKAEQADDSSEIYIKAIKDNPDDFMAYRSLYSLYMRMGRYTDALKCAYAMLDISISARDSSRELQADSYVGQAYLAVNRKDSAYVFFDNGLGIWDAKDSTDMTRDDYEAVYTILNAKGIMAVNKEYDYEEGIRYFMEGLTLAEKNQDYYNYAILGSNLVMTYWKRKDTSGMQYAMEIYDYGGKSGYEYVKYAGAHVTALMYYLKGNMDSARKYIEEIMPLSTEYFNTPSVYCLYANILVECDSLVEADGYFRKAIALVDEDDPTSASEIYLSYGKFLLVSGKIHDAETMFNKGIDICDRGGSRVYRHELLESLSLAQEKEMKYRQALETYKQFHIESYDIFSLEHERAVNSIQRKYEYEHHAREMQQQANLIQKKKRELFVSAIITVAVIICMLVTYLMYRNKDRMYTKIARQYKELVDQRQQQEKREEDKNSELFARLEDVMKNKKLYLEKNLTRERAAEMIGSNRTYLSQMINEKTGMSFVHYVNNYRLNEAIEILSNPNDKIPMKALADHLGFSSPGTFYKLFLEKVGMTPAKYREKIIELSENVN